MELRREVSAAASQALSSGWTRIQVSEVLGISQPTLARWLEGSDGPWRAVSVVPEREEARADEVQRDVRVVSPSGWVIEGLDLASAVDIVASQK